MTSDDIQTPEPTVTFRQMVDSALRFWEPCRLIYNGVLALIVLWMFNRWVMPEGLGWHDLPAYLMGFFVLAVIANILYCAAYVVDIFMQFSSYRASWIMSRRLAFTVGLMFAMALTYYMCLMIFRVD